MNIEKRSSKYECFRVTFLLFIAILAGFGAFYLLKATIFNHLGYAGGYSQLLNDIEIFPNGNGLYPSFNYFAHEFGHYYYFKIMTDEEKNKYNEIWKDTNFIVSSYSRTNPQEGFAEEFAYTIDCSINVDRLPENRREFYNKIYKTTHVYYLE